MSAAFFGIMAWTVFHSPMNGTPGKLTFERMVSNNTQEIGMTLFGAYLLPFEITSVLLLSAMVGAIVLAKRRLD